GIDRRMDAEHPPVEFDRRGIRLDAAGEHIHQRALAGAIAADEPVHPTPAQLEVDTIEHERRSVMLARARDLQCGARPAHRFRSCRARITAVTSTTPSMMRMTAACWFIIVSPRSSSAMNTTPYTLARGPKRPR